MAKQVFIDTLKIHDIAVPNLGFLLDPKITGVGAPKIRQTAYDISGAHGGYASKTRYSARLIGLTGLVYGPDVATYAANRKALEAACRLREDSNGIDILNTLYFTGNDGSLYQIQGAVQDFECDDENVLSSPFLINFYCGFPYFLKQAQSTQSFNIPAGGGVVVPFIVPVTLAGSTGGVETLTNNGTAETYPLLTLSGPLTNPVIQNITTGEFIAINVTLQPGDVLIIDMTPPLPTVVLNDSQDLIANISDTSDFWYLDVGANIIKLSSSNNADTGTVLVAWNDAFLGM